MKKPIHLHIEGMSCGGCVQRVEKALQDVAGVKSATVNLTAETAAVEVEQDRARGGDLVNALRKIGYDGYVLHPGGKQASAIVRGQQDKLREQQQAFVHALSTGVPIIALHFLGEVLGSGTASGHVWSRAIQAILCTVLLLSAAGAPIVVGGIRAILHRTPNMDLLVSVGVLVAYFGGVAVLVTASPSPSYFHAAAMILVFINLGRFFEIRARRDATAAVTDLAELLPREVQLMTKDGLETCRLEEVKPGDRINVPAGVVVPVDGEVIVGGASIDQSSMTGESMPVELGIGAEVFSGTTVVDGRIVIEATRIGTEATMGRILEAVKRAQSGKTRLQRIADRFAGILVPIVVAVAVITLALNRLWLGEWSVAVSRTIAVLVIACPCAMGLATPTAIMVATAVAAKWGILIRDAAAWERAAGMRVLLIDKTGTITEGNPGVSAVFDEPLSKATLTEDAVLQWMASAEQHATHPIAPAIVAAAKQRGLPLKEVDDFTIIPGGGCEAVIENCNVVIGSLGLLESREIDVSRLEQRATQLSADGQTIVYLAINGECAGLVGVRDEIRASAPSAVAALKRMGIVVVMVTGDRAAVAADVAGRVGIASVEAEMAPEDKLQVVRRHKDLRETVGVVGDGINDSPSLAAADVGVTFADAGDFVIGAADVTLLGDDLRRIPQALALSRRTARTIRQNLFWAFGYNAAAIPLAAFGWVPPGLAAALMMVSSLSVVMNSLRLRSGVTVADAVADHA
ncbi:MAG: heavy metal translocating P-type ATPase [Planctomycetota bacterium]|jgi:Cu+-exporting ATPase